MNDEQVVHIHLFNIKYGKGILSNGYEATGLINLFKDFAKKTCIAISNERKQ